MIADKISPSHVDPRRDYSVRERRGFTLVELLVVIAIISLLVSMLLPVVSRAKAVTIRGVCASNYRQLEVAAATYCSDSKDAVPWLNDGGYGALGYGGDRSNSVAGIQTNSLCRFSNDYLNAAWTYNPATSRYTIPKVMICPGLVKGMLRTYQNATYATPDIGQVTNIGNTVGFGCFMGLYHNNTSSDRSGTGSNGGINGRWRTRDPGNDSSGLTGTNLLRNQEFLNPSSDVTFVDIEFQNGSGSTKAALNWSIPHGASPTQPDGINQGYADGSVRWFNHSQMNYYYQCAYPWSTWMFITPLCLDVSKPALFNIGGYPTQWGWQPTTGQWYGVTTPNAGGAYTP